MFRIFQIIFFIFLSQNNIFCFDISSNDNYKIYKTNNYSIIYTDQYNNEASFIQQNLDKLLQQNNQSFGYTMDQPLKIVLVSDNVQIANAFSTQVPYNLDVYYNGGGDKLEYFSSLSWLKTLLTHEITHNYQTNAKKSKVSQTLYNLLGNNYMPIFMIVPLFTLPNIMLPTSFLEGDAVLNESAYSNGGRLYNAQAIALKNSMVFANRVTPTSFINDTQTFPYGRKAYIIGGFYMQYLAYKYGIDKVNSFFYNHSEHYINPFILDETFLKTFGIHFDQSIYDFVFFTKHIASSYTPLQTNDILAKSQSFIQLSKINNKIYFITTNLTNKKELNIYDINNANFTNTNTDLLNGKVFKLDNKLYTSSDNFISPTLYKQALFDENLLPNKKTIGKAIQDIYQNHIAYIDLKNSFLNSQLFIDGKFYDTVVSNAIFDKDGNIYYFKQNKNIKQLYKNKQKLIEFQSYSGKIVDIVNNDIFFISNTKNGSGLYKYSNNKIYLVNKSDNIIDGKIVDNQSALVETIDYTGYQICKIDITNPIESDIPIVSNIPSKTFTFDNSTKTALEANSYNEVSNLQFSLLNPYYATSDDGSSIYMFNALFTDPLMFNTLNIYGYKDIDKKLIGLNYTNQRYTIPFNINLYNIKRLYTTSLNRSYGGDITLMANLLKQGRYELNMNIKQYYDDENKNKNPIAINLQYKYTKNFPIQSSPYRLHNLKLLYKYDRTDNIYGFDYYFNRYVINELYGNAQIKYLNSDADIHLYQQRGIKVVYNPIDLNNDDTNMLIEGLDFNFYTKDISKLSVGLSYDLYFHHYFPIFPISIQKEKLFVQHNYFKLNDYDIDIKENIIGVQLDLLFVHKLPIPLIIKYINNDFSQQKDQIKFSLGVEF